MRRELSANYVSFEPDYAAYSALPEWAKATLGRHAADPRPALYDEQTLIACATHDPHWNAAMRENARAVDVLVARERGRRSSPSDG